MFFGIPVAVIIIVNSVFFFLTIYNIRRLKTKQKKTDIRRFSRSKTAADKDVKFYIQIGFILGFTWIIGFFLTTFSASYANLKIVYQILTFNNSLNLSSFISDEIINVFVVLQGIANSSRWKLNSYTGFIRRYTQY